MTTIADKKIAGKTVVLTGASRGIGETMARAFANQGATVVGVARSEAGLDRVCADIKANGGQAISIVFDLSDVGRLPHLVQTIEQLAGPIDILINNAGVEIYRAFADYSLVDLQMVLNLNLLSAMELTRLVLPRMLARRSGHIVNMASIASKRGHPYDSIYSASKAGLLMWSDALRQELADTGVSISAICPGYVAGQGMLADTGIPAPRLAGTSTPEAVAIAVLRAIERNQAEVMVNQDWLTETLTRLVIAISQFFPRFGDTVNRWLGVTQLNQLRVQPAIPSNILIQPDQDEQLFVPTANGSRSNS
ncbi:MAG: SDR family NAD(P)-dependent oxidoreductase [Kovacikia sp.]